MGTMRRDFNDFKKTYKAVTDYNEKQLELVMSLCPYQKNDKVKLVRYLKYFPFSEVDIGSVAKVTGVDWNAEYNYILSVSFPHIPKRYFWMPAYLFRSADWVEKAKVWKRTVSDYSMSVEPIGDLFACRLLKNNELLNDFSTATLDQGLDTLESVYHSYRITHR